MVSKNKRVLKKNHEQNKKYSYNLGNVTLELTLRSDIKEDMKSFLEILESAKKDIHEQLAKL